MPIQEKLSGIRDRSKEYGVRVVAGTAIAMGIVGLAGCSNAEMPQPEPTSISTEVPSEEPTEEPTPIQTETEKPEWYNEENIIERGPIPAELEQYRDMSVEAFQALPLAEQQAYASWLTSYRDRFVEVRSMTTKLSEDPLPTTLTPESSPEEILNDYLLTIGMAAYQTEGTPEPQEDRTCGPLNESDVAKLISATFAEEGVDNFRDETIDAVMNIADGQAVCPLSQSFPDWGILSPQNYTVTGTRELPGPIEIDGQSLQGLEITYEVAGLPAGDRSHFSPIFMLQPVQNPDGSDGFRAVRHITYY